MGVCLSCRGRNRRRSEKKSELQLCQSLAPLHECNGECDNAFSVNIAGGASGQSGDEDPVHRASVASPAGLEPRLLATSAPASLRNATRKKTVSSFKETLETFNKFNANDHSNGKQSLSLLNGHAVSMLNKKDDSCNSKCDSLSSDLIHVKPCGGNGFSILDFLRNMMTNPIKGLVSKQRKRYTLDGYNLDLSYINNDIIAMGFPAKNVEGCYRNHITDVMKFLDEKHMDHYKIYNLCKEKSYNATKFHNRVSQYPFEDHNPPSIDLIRSFCEDVDIWLSTDNQNVAAVHCKAGKGRTGTMICCYLLHIQQFSNAIDALNYYAKRRTHNKKGVTIPSQRRYVEYYAALLGMLKETGVDMESLYLPPKLQILEVIIKPPPILNGGQIVLELFVSEANQNEFEKNSPKVSLGSYEVRKSATEICMNLDRCTPLVGDIKLEVFNKPKKEKLFHLWFNTFFVTHEVNSVREDMCELDGTKANVFRLTMDKWQLDSAHKDKKDKIFSPDFKVELVVKTVQSTMTWGQGRRGAAQGSPPSNSHSSSAEEDSEVSLEPEEGWDSAVGGEQAALLGHYRLLSEPELDLASHPLAPSSPPATPRADTERMLQA